jgi:hypothetical protein
MNLTDTQISKKAGPVAAGSGFANVTTQASIATYSSYSQCERMCKPKALSFYTPTGRVAIASREGSLTSPALVQAHTKCITALEMYSWVYQLGGQMHRLRHYCCRAIEILREPDGVGWHGRYVLQTPCQVGWAGDAA